MITLDEKIVAVMRMKECFPSLSHIVISEYDREVLNLEAKEEIIMSINKQVNSICGVCIIDEKPLYTTHQGNAAIDVLVKLKNFMGEL